MGETGFWSRVDTKKFGEFCVYKRALREEAKRSDILVFSVEYLNASLPYNDWRELMCNLMDSSADMKLSGNTHATQAGRFDVVKTEFLLVLIVQTYVT